MLRVRSIDITIMKEFYIQWHITNLCNSRCEHCYQATFRDKDDLKLAKLKKVCDEIAKSLSKWRAKGIINITGGEPLLKKELFDLLKYLDNKKQIKKLSLITNFTLITPEILEEFKKIKKLKEIKFSLEGLTSASNDSIRGRGSFVKIMQALDLINKQKRIKSTLMFTVLKQNKEQVRGLLNFCREFQVDGFIVERFIPLGHSRNKKEKVLSASEYKRVAKDLLEICKLDMSLDDLVCFRAFFVKIRDKKPLLFGAPCTIADDGCCIMPNGDVYPCRRFGKSIGNILKKPFVDIIDKSKMLVDMRTRGKLKGKCKICKIKGCRGCRALAFNLTGDYLAEDEQCWI